VKILVVIGVIAASLLYWALASVLAFLALLAPCGLAPGPWCDDPGPSWIGIALGALGPVGVLSIAAIMYVGALGLIRRQWKSH
jgi:hypothetical protein